jgi:hypothetical protein
VRTGARLCNHRHHLVRSLQSRHGLPDRPRSVRGFSFGLVPLAQRHDSLPLRDHRTRPGSSCPRLDARCPRWHWRQGCCWCCNVAGATAPRGGHESTGPAPARRVGALAPATRGGVRSTAGSTSPDPRVPAVTRTRSPEPCQLLVASLARCHLVPISGGVGCWTCCCSRHEVGSRYWTCWCS